MYELFEIIIIIIEMNKQWEGENVAFNWFSTFLSFFLFNSCEFGELENRTKNWNHMGDFSLDLDRKSVV